MTRQAFVLVTTSFPIAGDGSEAAGSFVSDLAEQLAIDGPVHVVAPGGDSTREHWCGGVDVFRYPAPEKPLSTLRPWRLPDAKWIARVLRGGLQATRAATADGPSHLLALWGLPCGEWARRVARERRIGYSVWMLGSDVWSLGKIPGLRGALARVIRQAEHAYADGYRLADDAGRIAGSPVTFLPSTRRIALSAPAGPRYSPPYRLIFLGRWHANKGVDLLLDALDRLGDDDWERIERIDIQGGGPLDKMVRSRALGLQRAGRPVHAGQYLAKVEAEAAIASADWVLIPSRIESIPVVFSDAMKLGRPVVSMPVGDLPRLVAGAAPTGVLAGALRADAYADALRVALATSPDQFAEDVSAMASKFDLATLAGALR